MKPALLLVDLQQDFLAASALQPPADALTAQAAALLIACRQRRIPVVHVWTTVSRENDRRMLHWRQTNRWVCVAGTPGHKPPASLQPLDGETIIHKTGFNAFSGTGLDAALKQLDCDTLILAGLHLHACVRAAATECIERNYQVYMAEDAIASNDPIHAASTRRWLAERSVNFTSIPAILQRLDGHKPSNQTLRSPHSTAKKLDEVPVAGEAEVAAATSAAHTAWISWRQTDRAARRELIARIASRLEKAAPDLARQMAIEIGKPITHGLEEVHRAARNVHDAIHRASQHPQLKRESAGIIRYEPLGVVGLISPWNNPVAIPIGKIAPALLFGNTVVWKPSPAAADISQVILQLLRDAGVPPDVVRLLNGDHTTAQLLARDTQVQAVTLTGSLLSGYAIQEICARRMVPLQAELSGNNAAIVWEDANLADAARQVAWGAFGYAGQRCTANRRVIIPERLFQPFLQELKRAGEKLAWGDPLETTTDIGPVINCSKRDELTAIIARAQADPRVHHVELLHKERATAAWMKAGAYVQPAIICCDEPDHPVVQEESMGPILVVQRAADFAHALALCNGVRHGLIASLFSNSPALQQEFLNHARAGILKLNTATAGVDVTLPFGGWKASGLGPPEHGDGDPLFYTRMQAVYGAEHLSFP